ncbi:MAG: bifunctional phosphoribosylaminoimidazolecarboxamide formyltransferase/IMP cyclohydrolase [bacterium]
MKINRVLISVSDKKGIVEFAHELTELGIEIYSTGGTAKTLKQAEVGVHEVAELTGFPEILEGRVKTLHPKIFGALLAKPDNLQHQHQLRQHDIEPLEMIVVNLYPFDRVLEESDLSEEEMVEYIDIGGVALIRAAAKNFKHVTVICDPADYGRILRQIKDAGETDLKLRRSLAAKAFNHTAFYDSVISNYFADKKKSFPNELALGLKKIKTLRYGENPHQEAALYSEITARSWGIVKSQQLHGKELSFNNYLDLEAAWETVNDFNETACVIIKHTNPCGVAAADKQIDAFKHAFACDTQSAFGGIVGLNREVTLELAEEIAKIFIECIIAPGYTADALAMLKKKKNLRILQPPSTLISPNEIECRQISGGLLIQQKDNELFAHEMTAVTSKKPDTMLMKALEFNWVVCKHVKSNAIILGSLNRTLGVGAGQMSRIDSVKIAYSKMKQMFPILTGTESQMPLVLASDAFFPFRDVVDEASKIGVSAIIQPGGSVRDQDSIDAANEHGIAMVFTGMRHFRH